MIEVLLFATITMAQQDYVQSPTDIPFQVHQEPQIEIQDNAKIHYDIYDRVTLVEEVFPLGYTATTEYTWWPNTYLREDGAYEPRIQKEVGKLFNKKKQQVAYFSITYDEQEQEIEKVTEGNQLVRRLLALFATILGVEIPEDDPFQ